MVIDDGQGGTIQLELVDEEDVPDGPAVFARRFTGSLGGGFARLGEGTVDLLIHQDGRDIECLTMVLTGVEPHEVSLSKMLAASQAGGGYEIPITGFAGWFGR